MPALAFILVAAVAAATPDGLVDALDAARAPSVASVTLLKVAASDGASAASFARSAGSACTATAWDVPKIARAGRVRVRGRGDGCSFWLSVDVRVEIESAVLSRDVAKGEVIDDAVAVKRLAQGSGFVPPPGARAARAMKAGTTVNTSDIGPAVAPGTKVAVTLVRGELRLEDSGTIVACANATCARTRGGALVKGTMRNGALVVEVQ